MFSETSVDFTGFFTLPAPLKMTISSVKQKAFIEVNEKGTEAAAVTHISSTIFTKKYFESPNYNVL